MSSVDVEFCRALLRQVMPVVKRMLPNKDLRTVAWTYKASTGHWEFHGPDGYYWHGRASNAYDARYKGWMEWLRKEGIDLDKEQA
jgi:hypothetical protein